MLSIKKTISIAKLYMKYTTRRLNLPETEQHKQKTKTVGQKHICYSEPGELHKLTLFQKRFEPTHKNHGYPGHAAES